MQQLVYNNNNEYLERLTRTGPKRLHVAHKYTLSKFNAYNMNAHTHTHTLTHTHRLAHARTIYVWCITCSIFIHRSDWCTVHNVFCLHPCSHWCTVHNVFCPHPCSHWCTVHNVFCPHPCSHWCTVHNVFCPHPCSHWCTVHNVFCPHPCSHWCTVHNVFSVLTHAATGVRCITCSVPSSMQPLVYGA